MPTTLNKNSSSAPLAHDENEANEERVRQQNRAAERKSSARWLLLFWDVTIVVLVAFNLGLIILDSFFILSPINQAFASLWPSGHALFDTHIHQNFQSIDLVFVSIFITDVFLSWIVAVCEKRHERWWFYPFVHWYDVLGCIPLAGFRFLRVLRVVSILFRLQRLGLIDVRSWGIYKFCERYYSILIEEVSDRVVENVLTGVQDEIRDGASDLPKKIINQVIVPRQERLVDEITTRISETTGGVYSRNRSEVHDYIGGLIKRAVHSNSAAQTIDRIPGLGDAILGAIDDTLTDTSCDLIDEVVKSLSSKEFEEVLNSMLDSILADVLGTKEEQEKRVAIDRLNPSRVHVEAELGFGGAAKDQRVTPEASGERGQVMIEVLDIVKEQVRKKRWKSRF